MSGLGLYKKKQVNSTKYLYRMRKQVEKLGVGTKKFSNELKNCIDLTMIDGIIMCHILSNEKTLREEVDVF